MISKITHRTTEAPEQSLVTPVWEPCFTEEQNAGFYRRQLDNTMAATLALSARVKRLEDAMKEVRDELAEDFDINANGTPNKAMSLSNTLGEALYGPGGF